MTANGNDSYIAAPNIIHDGKCAACSKDVDTSSQGIQCHTCKNWFHAIGCQDDSLTVSSSTSFVSHLLPAVTRTGTYARTKRFGCFYFMCDFCVTASEVEATVTTNDHVTVLDKKIDNLRSDFKSELNDIKEALKSLKSDNQSSPYIDTPNKSTASSSDNPWDDAQKTDHLKHMMVIKKDESGNSVDKKVLEKACVENGVGILNTFKLNKSEDTAVVLKSKKDADLLKQKLSCTLPNHKLDQMTTRIPRITIVGLERQYNKDELKDMICKQNPGIAALLSDAGTSELDKKLDIVAILPLKNNSSLFKAIVLVSNLIRSVISKQSDRIYIGLQRVCKVYDSFFVLRCYNCQDFGHHSKDCTNTAVCGYCSGEHQTRSCERKADPVAECCNNCKKADSADLNHSANAIDCPLFKKLQDKVRKTTPFHQNKK